MFRHQWNTAAENNFSPLCCIIFEEFKLNEFLKSFLAVKCLSRGTDAEVSQVAQDSCLVTVSKGRFWGGGWTSELILSTSHDRLCKHVIWFCVYLVIGKKWHHHQQRQRHETLTDFSCNETLWGKMHEDWLKIWKRRDRWKYLTGCFNKGNRNVLCGSFHFQVRWISKRNTENLLLELLSRLEFQRQRQK